MNIINNHPTKENKYKDAATILRLLAVLWVFWLGYFWSAYGQYPTHHKTRLENTIMDLYFLYWKLYLCIHLFVGLLVLIGARWLLNYKTHNNKKKYIAIASILFIISNVILFFIINIISFR